MSDELPPGWAVASMSEVAEVQLGRQRSPQHHTGDQMRPYLRSANVTWSGIDLGDVKEMNFDDADFEKYRLRAGDLLLNEASGSPNEVGKPAIWHGEIDGCCFQNTLLRLQTPELDRGYVYWYCHLSARSGRFGDAGRGVNIRHLGKQGLARFPIPIAPVAEQKRIVAAIEEHFSRLDAADRSMADVQVKLASLQRAAVAQLFDRADWPWTTLGEIAALKGGVTKDSKRQSDPCFVEVPYLRVANVQRGFLDLSEVTTIRVSPTKAAQLALRRGDILFNEGGDRDKLGRGWVWEGQIGDCIHQNHVFRARLCTGDFDPYFISVHGNTWGQRWFETHGKQTTNLATLNLTTLKSFPIPAPPLAEQRGIVAELESIRRNEDRLGTEILRAESRSAALRRSILAAAFSGRLVPQDADDEPASVLLARIAATRPAGRVSQSRSARPRSARGTA
ncbi:MAG: restriction endonuclease subunit S [bacterium]|nr:restriction endonuclease subunit S [bacterium]